MDLNQNGKGEQVVTSALIAGGMVTFSTNRPVPAPAGSCSTTLGEARGYWVNLLNASGAIGVTAPAAASVRRCSSAAGCRRRRCSPTSVRIGGKGETVSVVMGAVQKSGVGARRQRGDQRR